MEQKATIVMQEQFRNIRNGTVVLTSVLAVWLLFQ